MTDANKRANIAAELSRSEESMRAARVLVDASLLFVRIQKYRLEADYGRDFVLTPEALRDDLASCQAFLDRVHVITAAFLGSSAGK